MNILLMLREAFYDADSNLIEELKKIGHVKILYTDKGIGKEELINEVKNIDIILVNVVKIDKEVMDAARNLKYIVKFGAGVDNIDVAYARQKGIRVTSAPGLNAEAVADHAFGLMLSAAREIPKKDKEVKSGYWETTMGYEIHKKKLGIIGFGSIGKALAKRAMGFDMETMAYGNYKDYELAKKLGVTFVERDQLFKEADYIIISTSLTATNKHLVNKETLALMKPTAFLINISRGGLVKEEDLIEALKSGKIKGAALDVFEKEPPVNELPLLENVVATPHVGGASYEAVSRISNVSIANIIKLMNGEDLEHEV